MEMTNIQRLSIAAIVLGFSVSSACRRTAASPPPSASPVSTTQAFTIIKQELREHELMVVVAVPDALKSNRRDELLRIADDIHATHGQDGRTVIVFRDQNQPLPARELSRAEEYSHAFAIAIIDPTAGIRKVDTNRIFN